MTCDEARELIGADPEGTSPELLSHLAKCPECQAYREQLLAFNTKIRQALELDWQKVQPTAPPGVPPIAASGVTAEHGTAAAIRPTAGRSGAAASAPIAPASATPTAVSPVAATPVAASPAATQAAGRPAVLPPAVRSNVTPFRRSRRPAVAKHRRPRLFAFGVSVAAALVVAFTLWLSRPPESLAAEIVTHVKGEPNSWQKTQPVGAEKVDAVLRKSGVKLGQGMQPVVYASSCWFRGHFVPHFVVMTKDGPVTVMILLNEKVQAAQQFNEEGYSGLLVPVRTGSVAVLSRTPISLEQPASDVAKALQSAN
jgi:hypothetical protein